MFETLIGLGVVLLFGVLAWAARASAEALLFGGLGLAGLGFAYGIPTALVYHWLLHRSWRIPGMTTQRYAIESWFFAPSAFPGGRVPMRA